MGMFRKKQYVNRVLIEGPTQAMCVAAMENLPDVNPKFEDYPVDMTLRKRRTFKEAVKKMMEFSDKHIYSVIIKKPKDIIV